MLGPGLGLDEDLGGLLGIKGGENGLLLFARQLLEGVGQVLAGQLLDLVAGDGERNDVGAGGILDREGLDVAPRDELMSAGRVFFCAGSR